MFSWIYAGYYGSGGGNNHHGGGAASSVPEMDAASGTLAIAIVLAALVLLWEIKRRRPARA